MVMENGAAVDAFGVLGARTRGAQAGARVSGSAVAAQGATHPASADNAKTLSEKQETGRCETGDSANDRSGHFPYGIDHDKFVLQYVQPGLVGLIDGTVSSLAPIFAAAVSSSPKTAFLVGMATALGAGVSMGWSEALSDTGKTTGRGSAIVRGAITGGMTTIGGTFHTLPFLISSLQVSLLVALVVVAIELLVIAWVRYRFLHVPIKNSLLVVTLGGVIVLAIGLLLGES
jgi:hypothetical protein